MSPPATSIVHLLPADRERALAVLTRRAGGAGGGVLDSHLQRLRDLPAHGNRKLKVDQLLLGLLLSFFDPVVRSLRLIEDSGDFGGRLDLGQVQNHL